MSDDVDVDVEELPDLPEIDPQSISFEGHLNEMLDDLQVRIEELTSALDELHEAHPQTGIVRFELAMIIEAREALKARLENLEGYGEQTGVADWGAAAFQEASALDESNDG